jgi:hypothetical protein
MSKAENATTTVHPDRRAMLVKSIALGATLAAMPAISNASVGCSASFRECVALYDGWGAYDSDEDADQAMERYEVARDRFLAEPVTSGQRVGEIAVLWRLEWWSGDHKIGEPGDPKLERALWKAVEALSGVALPEGN